MQLIIDIGITILIIFAIVAVLLGLGWLILLDQEYEERQAKITNAQLRSLFRSWTKDE